MIPKKIHYCWFGGNPMPEKDQKCIESWKRYCPDYEIIRWDESNYDITKNRYMKEAYEAKKWGFVPDFARLDIIYEHGGIYLDTDVEIVKNLDALLNLPGYMGFEGGDKVNPGLGFGAEKNNPTIKSLIDSIYSNRHFVQTDGSLDLTPSPKMNTDALISMGLVPNDLRQEVNSIVVFPSEYFCPKNLTTGVLNITENTHTIHWFNGSWLSDNRKKIIDINQKYIQKYGKEKGSKISSFLSIPYKVKEKYDQIGVIGLLKYILHKAFKR